MLIDQALDATVFLSTLSLFNVIFTAALVVISLGPLSLGTRSWSITQKMPLAFNLFVANIVLGCIYPLILLGLETFGPLHPVLVQIAIILGVGLPFIILIMVARALMARLTDEQAAK